MTTRYRPRLLLAFLALSALAGCGGGGSDSTATTPPGTAPVITLGFGVGQVEVSWPAVSGATYYKLYRDPDGADVAEAIEVNKSITGTSTQDDVALYLGDWINSSYYVKACNSAGCSGVSNELTVMGTAAATANNSIGYVKSSTAARLDIFGHAVAVSADGNTMAVGAYADDNTGTSTATGTGAVYIFARNSSTGLWKEQARVQAHNPGALDLFGWRVALSDNGNVLAVGAPREDSDSNGVDSVYDEAAGGAGAVYVFARSNNVWNTTPVYVKATDSAAANQFGSAIALSGDGTTLAVGAPGRNSSAGAVYVYARNNGWSEKIVTPSTSPINYPGAGDQFGYSVALSGDGKVLAAGAPLEDSTNVVVNGTPNDVSTTAEVGAVYVFDVNYTGAYVQMSYSKADNAENGDEFGTTVALSSDGNTMAVGAPKEDGGIITGGVCFAEACADNDAQLNSGAVYLFSRSGSFQWFSPEYYLKASNPQADDGFGNSLAMSADGFTLAVGAERETSSAKGINAFTATDDNLAPSVSGAAYLYASLNNQWYAKAYIKAPNPDEQEKFGSAVGLSSDGKTLAIGASEESSSASGLVCASGAAACADAQAIYDLTNADGAGAVYLF